MQNNNYRSVLITEVSSFQEDMINSKGIKIFGIDNINQQLSNHFLIYEILNLSNGKYYIGQHETTNPYDNYMGSGHYLAKAKAKTNLSSFAKIILYDFDNYNDMNIREYEMVQLSDCYPYNEMSYNLMEGSHNGRLSQESIDKANKTKAEHGGLSGENNPMFGEKMLDHMTQEAYDEMRRKQIENNKLADVIHEIQSDSIRYTSWCKAISDGRKGLKLSAQHKLHVGSAIKKLHLHWWNNGIIEIKCTICPDGFSKGRIKKKWWNNGITEVLQAKCPIGFTEGRLPLSQEHKEKIGQFGKGKHWWNNGLINVFSIECPNEFKPGKIHHKKY